MKLLVSLIVVLFLATAAQAQCPYGRCPFQARGKAVVAKDVKRTKEVTRHRASKRHGHGHGHGKRIDK